MGLGQEEDARTLEWAAETGHVLVTHDASTMTDAAYKRLEQGLRMPGLLVARQTLGVGETVRRLVDLLDREPLAHLDGIVKWL